jgi:hypothetical protein
LSDRRWKSQAFLAASPRLRRRSTFDNNMEEVRTAFQIRGDLEALRAFSSFSGCVHET